VPAENCVNFIPQREKDFYHGKEDSGDMFSKKGGGKRRGIAFHSSKAPPCHSFGQSKYYVPLNKENSTTTEEGVITITGRGRIRTLDQKGLTHPRGKSRKKKSSTLVGLGGRM